MKLMRQNLSLFLCFFLSLSYAQETSNSEEIQPLEVFTDSVSEVLTQIPGKVIDTVKVDTTLIQGKAVALIDHIEVSEFDKKWLDSWKLNVIDSSLIIKPEDTVGKMVIEKLYEITKGDAYVTSDVGQHQMFTAQFYKFDKPRRWINSGGLGTMGFGLPAAMGVQLAHRDATVACVTGEASIQMCIQELSTCMQYELPIKIVNLNNRYMGMVRQWQEFIYESRYSHSYMEALPNFVKLAESYGHIGIQVNNPEDIEDALKEAFSKYKKRLVFLDFITDQSENVYPMIMTGQGHNEMYLSSASRGLA